jgi:hypothetical protein
MKKKLALDLERLAVESFETALPAEGRGTVRGHDSRLTFPACTDTEWASCEACIPPSERVTECWCSFDGEGCA